MKTYTCCFTGHRILSQTEFFQIQKHLEAEIINLIKQGIRYFGTGGALGFDTLAAQIILKLKSEFPHIRLILVLPCKSQTKNWREADIKIYDQIRQKADKVVYTSEHYYPGCLYARNRHLVNESSVCLCFLNKNHGGTAYTVKYAKSRGLHIINIAE